MPNPNGLPNWENPNDANENNQWGWTPPTTPPEGDNQGEDKPTYEEIQQQLKDAKEQEEKRRTRAKRWYRKSKSNDDWGDQDEIIDKKFAERDFKGQFWEERFKEVSKIAEDKEITLDDAHAIYLWRQSLDEQLQNQKNVWATMMHWVIPPKEKWQLPPEIQKVTDKALAKFLPKKDNK